MDDLDFGATIKGFAPGQKVFNRYTLKKILGRGGMGVVWLARDEELEREVALKFLPEVVAMDREAVRDLKRETRRSLDLTHPHIVRIYDFIQDVRTAAISMEYVAGETLAARKLDHPAGHFEPPELARWVRQLCEALAYAHTKGEVVHRDLKPANLMIDARGDLKIADFGIAASVSDSVSRVSAQAGGSSGTPLYMSPQQMLGEKPCVADDIYSLGATLYELLTGKPPFYSGNVLLQVQSKRPPPIAERRQELAIAGEPVPREWEATIAACLSKEAKDRPASTEEVAERLGLAASAAGRKEQGAGSKVEKTTGAATVPGVERLAPKTLIGSADQASGPKRSGSKSVLYVGLAAAVVLLAGVGYYFGIYAPEQARLEAEAVKLRTEQERVMAEAKAKAEQERLAAERLAGARGGIAITTEPTGAEVQVAALALDKSPLTLKDQRLGKYPVRIRLEGYEDWTGEVEVKENDFSRLNVTLVRSQGTVLFSWSPAGARVIVNGGELHDAVLTESQTQQESLTSLRSRLPTGTYTVRFELKGYKSQTKTVVVKANEQVEVAAALEKQEYSQSGQPFVNTLGMEFVPVPGTDALFGVWDVRVQDYQAFVDETHREWPKPGFDQGPTHPAVNVSWDDAQAFCAWLTKKEQAAGRLGPDQQYRLPTDAEWSVAVGLDEPRAGTPQSKDAKTAGVYPWGTQWPPPAGAGNYEDAAAKQKHPNWTVIDGYDDGYADTSPVGRFAANRYGLYDMGGNVWQWCEDFYDGSDAARVLRGGSFDCRVARDLLSSSRNVGIPASRDGSIGFRCVVGVGGSVRPDEISIRSEVGRSAVSLTIEVSILGQVKNPGQYTLDRNANLLGAITKAGGVTDVAQTKTIRITRKAPDGSSQKLTVDLEEIMSGRATEIPVLQEGDVIYVPERII